MTPTLGLRDFNLDLGDPIWNDLATNLGRLFLLPSPSPNDTRLLLNIAVAILLSFFYTKGIGDNIVDAHRFLTHKFRH